MPVRYEMRPDISGWTVCDTTTGRPASVNGAILYGLSVDEVDDLVDLLNRLHVEQLATTSH